eukprot:6465007-Amphidinium_carterae.1
MYVGSVRVFERPFFAGTRVTMVPSSDRGHPCLQRRARALMPEHWHSTTALGARSNFLSRTSPVKQQCCMSRGD